jgi:hypothetical protein
MAYMLRRKWWKQKYDTIAIEATNKLDTIESHLLQNIELGSVAVIGKGQHEEVDGAP